MSYLAVKHLHMSCAVLTGLLFFLRLWWRWTQPARLNRGWVRVLPHLIDTVLLGSAITLAYLSGLYPLQQHWLTAKVLALLIYIVAGAMALRRAKTVAGRLLASITAIVCYLYILAAAHFHSAMPWLFLH